MHLIMVWGRDSDEFVESLSVVNENNLSISIGEWAALWPNAIFFMVEVTEV